MKTKLTALCLLISGAAMAVPHPLKQNVPLKNRQFSQKIYEALSKKLNVTRSGAVETLGIKNLITCSKTTTGSTKEYSCTLLKEGWRYMGSEVYGSGQKQDLTNQLYDALSVQVIEESGIKTKTIELNVPDRDGGTERNLLNCTRLARELEEMGLRNTCDVMNAL